MPPSGVNASRRRRRHRTHDAGTSPRGATPAWLTHQPRHTLLAVLVPAAIIGCGGPTDTSPQTKPVTSSQNHDLSQTNPAARSHKAAKRHPRTQAKTQQPAAAALPASYFGLGATVAQWKAQNPSFPPGRVPLGLFSYTIDRVAGGRVAAATVEVNARPKFGAFDLATSFALPDDKDPLNSDPRCRLWRSESLGAVLGLPYIISVADTVTQTAPAELRASRPHCA